MKGSRVAQLLAVEGHDAVHVADLDLLSAPDTRVMQAAAHAGRMLVAADTDFGELLALGRHPEPQPHRLRRSPHRVEMQVHLLVASLGTVADSLAEGAVVVLTPDQVRVRRLPITPTKGST